ncbi:MAG: tRNA pseudouridine(55) synthase TruB [Candidatus Limnocylindrales bacterium]|jgi:tRNA pseudouridine55 synthase
MSASGRATERGIDGILVLSKPSGPTSHDMVGLVRRLSGTRRVGHGGTLDPFAAGVLPVFLGLATRVVEYHMGDDKAYRATVCFGARSATDDRDGELVPSGRPGPTRELVEQALAAFCGSIEQRPPAFSAIKVGGRRAYQLARQGVAPELAPRTVKINRLELVEWDGSYPERPAAVLEVECGAGTYIRSLARDLGEQLGCGAYLGALTRTRSGPFPLETAHDLDAVRAAAAAGPSFLAALTLPIDAGLEGLPIAPLTSDEVIAAARGQQVRPAQRPHLEQGATVRLTDPGESLVGIGSWRAGRIVPQKMFVPPLPAQGGGAGEAVAAVEGGEHVEPPLWYARAGVPHEVVPGVDALRRETGRLYVAIGVFDGLHRGHLYLLRELRHAAARAAARPAVITFDAHPEEVVAGLAPALLCDPDERLVRLAAAGAEVTVVQHFDHSLRMTSYGDFVERIRSHVELAGFVMTPDAAFGRDRRGTPEALTQLGKEAGFEVTVVHSLLLDGEQVRSSEIRRRIVAGDLAAARRMLGRPLSVTGTVVAEPRPLQAAQLRFEVPVVLPPPGRYAVMIGPPWQTGSPAARADRASAAVVDEGGLWLEDILGGEQPDRLRVVFVD